MISLGSSRQYVDANELIYITAIDIRACLLIQFRLDRTNVNSVDLNYAEKRLLYYLSSQNVRH